MGLTGEVAQVVGGGVIPLCQKGLITTKNSLDELICLKGFELLLRYDMYRHVLTFESLLQGYTCVYKHQLKTKEPIYLEPSVMQWM